MKRSEMVERIYDYGGISVWFRWDDLELVLKEDYEYEMNLLDR